MDVANEILDAIEIIVDKKIREQATQIYSGICKNVNGDSCVMFINGKNNTVQFYGPTPIVGAIYKVFVPYGNMSSAFAITGIVAKSDDEDDKKDLYYSNPNLLDNWYFGNPINQRGQTSYSVNGYTIDRWYTAHSKSYGTLIVDQTAGCITLSHADDGGVMDFYQTLENPATEIVTLSVLMLNGNLYSTTGTIGNISLYTDEMYILSSNPSTVAFRCDTGKTISMIAAKLELGSQQTLAHQDANGNWVLNEIPDYGEQLRRCQRYFVNFNPNKVNWFAMPPAVASSTTDAYSAVTLPVAMRAQPTVSYGGKIALSQTGDVQVTSIQVSGNTFAGNYLQLRYSVADGLTASSTYRVQGYNDPTSYIWLSADL